jgi:hypothetical protein
MIVLIWLTACAPKVDTAPADPGPRDRDGDGYPAATDCDDLDPGATDRQVAYADGDGDGYGGAATEPLCTLPSGFVWTGGDCDDGSAGVYPGASEVCNGVDDDCDGRVDDADDSLDTSTGTWWSPDGDGDGYGDGTSGVWACGRPEGYVGNAEDCDDGAAEVRPGAEEVCNGVDDDCNGAADDLRLCDVVSVSEVAAATYVGNHREDVLGWTVAVLPDLTGDGKPDVAMGSLGWDNDSGEHLPGYLWVFDGQRRGEIEAADADVVYRAIWFGGSNTDITTPAATDLDGDGLADLVFHSDAHDWDDYAGGVYVNYGPLGSGHGISESDGRLLPPADLAFTSFFGSGFAVSNGAVLIGQYLAESGTVWLVHEPWWGDTVVTDLDAVRLSGEGYSSHAGWLVELADVTGDGVDDAMVSAPWLDWGGSAGRGGGGGLGARAGGGGGGPGGGGGGVRCARPDRRGPIFGRRRRGALRAGRGVPTGRAVERRRGCRWGRHLRVLGCSVRWVAELGVVRGNDWGVEGDEQRGRVVRTRRGG